ncbi:hypothetical protein ACFX15_008531 [Malus domestica]
MKKLLFQQGSDDRFREVGIVGGDSIGKTTLFQLLFDKQEVKNTFLPTGVSFIIPCGNKSMWQQIGAHSTSLE